MQLVIIVLTNLFFIGEEFKGRFQILGRMVRVLQRAKK